MRIASVVARQVLDCKARPLVEVEFTTDTGHVGRGASPTGTSVGVHEAFVIRDGNRAEYDGLSVHRAVSAVTDEIAPCTRRRRTRRPAVPRPGPDRARRHAGQAPPWRKCHLLHFDRAVARGVRGGGHTHLYLRRCITGTQTTDYGSGAQLQHDQRWRYGESSRRSTSSLSCVTAPTPSSRRSKRE